MSLLDEWKAFDMMEPMDTGYRVEVGLARICALMESIVIGLYAKKGAKPPAPKVSDYMSDWEGLIDRLEAPEPVKQSLDEMLKIMTGLAASSQQDKRGTRKK